MQPIQREALENNSGSPASRAGGDEKKVPLKADPFTGENLEPSAVDAQIKAPDDKPTIGLLLCRTQNWLDAEYALSGIDKPVGVAEYQLLRALPTPLDTSLPDIEEIEAELGRDFETEPQP